VLARTFRQPALLAEAALAFAALGEDQAAPRRALLEEALGKLATVRDESLVKLKAQVEVALGNG
jgi:hypothetical protein